MDSDALQHGLNIFQRQLRNRGLLTVTMGSNATGLRDFFGLVGATRMIEIKFLGYKKPPEHESESDLLPRILATRNDLLLRMIVSKIWGNLVLCVLENKINDVILFE